MKSATERIAALPAEKQTMLLQRLRQKTSPQLIAPLARPAPADPWIVRYQPNAHARIRLFCFPYAGGGASVFRLWSEALSPALEVCGIQLPGREHRLAESAYTRLDALVPALADAIEPYLDRPFAFFGHSMGALVSFALARQLRRVHNRQPVCLYLAAYRAPQLPNPNIRIYHLPSEVFKVVLRAEGIAEMVLQNEEIMQAMLPTLRADFELCDTYKYTEEPPFTCPLAIFGGLQDVRVGVADLEAWRIHSSATCTLSMFPGAHFFLHSAQDRVLAALSQHLSAYRPDIYSKVSYEQRS
jgi:surfactin synthase thioesterase subunit